MRMAGSPLAVREAAALGDRIHLENGLAASAEAVMRAVPQVLRELRLENESFRSGNEAEGGAAGDAGGSHSSSVTVGTL